MEIWWGFIRVEKRTKKGKKRDVAAQRKLKVKVWVFLSLFFLSIRFLTQHTYTNAIYIKKWHPPWRPRRRRSPSRRTDHLKRKETSSPSARWPGRRSKCRRNTRKSSRWVDEFWLKSRKRKYKRKGAFCWLRGVSRNQRAVRLVMILFRRRLSKESAFGASPPPSLEKKLDFFFFFSPLIVFLSKRNLLLFQLL